MDHVSPLAVLSGERSLLMDMKKISKIIQVINQSVPETEILHSGSKLRGHIAANTDIRTCSLQAGEIATSWLSVLAQASWFMACLLDQSSQTNYEKDFFGANMYGEDQKLPAIFLKGSRSRYPLSLYKKPFTDHLKQDTVADIELVKIGKTSVVRRLTWADKTTEQPLIQREEIAVLINPEERRPMDISQTYKTKYEKLEADPNYSWKLEEKRADASCKKLPDFRHLVGKKEIDANNHTNAFVYHALYLEALLKCTNEELYVKEFIINYKKESRKGDLLTVSIWEAGPHHYLGEIWQGDRHQLIGLAEIYLYQNIDLPELQSKL